MPQIPLYQRRQSIPGEAPAVPMNISAAGVVGESIAGFGKTGLAVTNELVEIIAKRNEELRKQNNAFAILKAQNSMDEDARAFKQSYDIEAKKGSFDPEGLMKFTKEKTDAFLKDLDKKYLSDIEDPDRKIRVEQYRNAAVSHILDHTSVFQANARKEFANNEIGKAVNLSIQDAREGTEPALVRKSIRLKIGELQAAGYLSEAQAEELIVKTDQALTVAYFDGIVALQPEKVMEKLKSKEYRQYLPEADYRRLMEKAKNLNEKKIAEEKKRIEDEKEVLAYAEASEKWPDPKRAMVEVLKPEFQKAHKLTINQAQNIAQSFSVIGSQKERDEKERQEKNLDAIRQTAINDPAAALKLIRGAEDVDPKEALSLQRATESHIRQMSLMSAQEKSLRMDLEDKIKLSIKAKILSGGYLTEKDVTNAVISEGLSNSSAFLDDALGVFRSYKKEAGSVNFFQQAAEDWKLLISTTKSVSKKRELKDMEPKVLEALRLKMEAENLRVSDPGVSEHYKAIKKEMTATWVTKTLEAVGSVFGTGDSMIKPPEAPAVVAPAPAMLDEATARKRLEKMGIKGAAQDKQIKDYRDAGLVK